MTQARRLLLAVVAGGAAFVLLSALAYAASHPDQQGRALLALAWCALPVAATAQLAVAVLRADPVTSRRTGLDTARPLAGSPVSVRRYGAVSAGLATLLGAVLGLGVFLHLRGELSGLPFDGRAAGALGAGEPLPVAAAWTLLAVVPLSAAGATAWALGRALPDAGGGTGGWIGQAPVADPGAGQPLTAELTGTAPGSDQRGDTVPGAAAGATSHGDGGATATLAVGTVPPRPVPLEPDVPGAALPASLPWGAALAAVGMALTGYGAGAPEDGGLPMPGQLSGVSAGVVAGWLVTALGLILLTPGLLVLAGRLLTSGRPGAARMLAGRGLARQAPAVGMQVGTLAAAGAAAWAAWRLDGPWFFGPLGAVGAVVVLVAAGAALVISASAVATARAAETGLLRRLGGSRLLRRTVLLRCAAVLLVLVPLVWLTAGLLALPLD